MVRRKGLLTCRVVILHEEILIFQWNINIEKSVL